MQRNTDTVDNHVIVRVWPANVTSSSPNSLMEVGHVSLKIYLHGEDDDRDYISFWPGDDKTNSRFWSWFADKKTGCPCKEKGCDQKVDHFHTREEDVQYCGQAQIENTYTFYTLDAIAISREFERRKRQGLKWTLSASLLPIKNEIVANCSSLVYDLLVCGGLDDLVNRSDQRALGIGRSTLNGLTYGAMIGIPIVKLGVNFASHYQWPIMRMQQLNATLPFVDNTPDGYYKYLRRMSSLEPMLPINFFSKVTFNIIVNFGKIGGISLLALACTATTGLAFWAYKLTANCLTIKPSDIKRIMPHAQEIDHKNRFFTRSNLPREIPQENLPLQRRFG